MVWNNIFDYRQFCGCLSDISMGIRAIYNGVYILGDYWGDNEG